MLDSKRIVRATQLDIAVARYGRPAISLIISGFWRSGTTWLQDIMAESLNAKTIFEPLAAEENIAIKMFEQIGIADRELQFACIPGPDLIANPDTLKYLDAISYGQKWGHFQRLSRRTVLESVRRRIIVKDVRFHFALSSLSRRYAAPILHIRRHPCAVIASLAHVRWPWSFDDITLSRLFAVSLSGSSNETWNRADIALRKFDGDTVSRVAAYWALVEWSAQQEATLTEAAKIVWYEDLVDDPVGSIGDLCDFFGFVAKNSSDHQRNSAVTSAGSKNLDPVNRKYAWHDQMDNDDIKRIIKIVETIYPELDHNRIIHPNNLVKMDV